MKMVDRVGIKYGKLSVLELAGRTAKGGANWLCQCECGGRVVVSGDNLHAGHSRSCGCLVRETSANQARKNARHGLHLSSEHRIWRMMNSRCRNQKDTGYSRYGGRGISICEEWRSFERFYADMGPRPTPQHTLDRRDNNGNYEPKNCRWATRREQQNNISSNVRLTMNDETMSISEWARRLDVPRHLIASRIRNGWPVDRALTEASR